MLGGDTVVVADCIVMASLHKPLKRLPPLTHDPDLDVMWLSGFHTTMGDRRGPPNIDGLITIKVDNIPFGCT